MNDAARELIGRTVAGRFRLTAFLGEGAMASVFRGEQDGEPRDVAVKIMHPELLRDATFAKRFTREAKAAARIVHPSSVRILEQGADGKLLYLAMELLVGQDLFDVLARERRLPEARAVRILVQVCGALTAAHAHGIVHRDLKPENIMILADPDDPGADRVKVLDFGIAKILDRGARSDDEPPRSESSPVDSAPPSSVLTMVGGLVGTPEYMSPEQATGQAVDARSDLYACGALLYHLVAGRPPFKSDHVVEVLMSHADKPPPPPSTFLPDIHPVLERLILKALAKQPDARHQTAAELAGELAALLPDLPASARAPRPSSRESAVPGSGSGRALPGVPISVSITAPSKHPPPPETLRSPASLRTDAPATGLPLLRPEDAPVSESAFVPAAPEPSPAVESAAAFAKTLAVEAAPEVLAKTLSRDPEPAALPVTTAAAEAAVVAITTKPPAEAPAPVPMARTAAIAGDRWEAPWWVFVLAVVILSAAIWGMRYVRLGAGG